LTLRQDVKTLTENCIFKHLKPCKSGSTKSDLRKTLLKSTLTRQRTTTQKYENTESHHKTRLGCCFFTNITAHILPPQISTSLKPSDNVILWKWFGSDDEVTEEVAASEKFKLVQKGE